jgi:hypothetical protein
VKCHDAQTQAVGEAGQPMNLSKTQNIQTGDNGDVFPNQSSNTFKHLSHLQNLQNLSYPDDRPN